MYKGARGRRYSLLRSSFFLPWEARELSKVERMIPTYYEGNLRMLVSKSRQENAALKAMTEARLLRRIRFEKIASTKIALGKWRRRDLGKKWANNLSRLYSKRGWRVREGPVGDQQKNLTKGRPNPFAMYRHYKKDIPDPPGYESPYKRKVSRRHIRVTKDMIDKQRERRRIDVRERRPYR